MRQAGCRRSRSLLQDAVATTDAAPPRRCRRSHCLHLGCLNNHLVDLARSVAHATRVEFTDARVDVVADAVAGRRLRMVRPPSASSWVPSRSQSPAGMPSPPPTPHSSRTLPSQSQSPSGCLNNRTRDGAGPGAYAAGIEFTDARVDVVAMPSLSASASPVRHTRQGVELVAIAVAIAFWDAVATERRFVKTFPSQSQSPSGMSEQRTRRWRRSMPCHRCRSPARGRCRRGYRRCRRRPHPGPPHRQGRQAGHRSRNRLLGYRRHRRRRTRQGRFRRSRISFRVCRRRIRRWRLGRCTPQASSSPTQGSASSELPSRRRRPPGPYALAKGVKLVAIAVDRLLGAVATADAEPVATFPSQPVSFRMSVRIVDGAGRCAHASSSPTQGSMSSQMPSLSASPHDHRTRQGRRLVPSHHHRSMPSPVGRTHRDVSVTVAVSAGMSEQPHS